MAYDLTVADTRNFDCFNGLCVRDTFHNAGVSSKSNVTRGVPRIEQILRLTKNMKRNSMTIFLNADVEKNKEEVIRISKKIENTKLGDVVSKVQLWFDPSNKNTQIPADVVLMQQFIEFEKWMESSSGNSLLVAKKMNKKEQKLEEIRQSQRKKIKREAALLKAQQPGHNDVDDNIIEGEDNEDDDDDDHDRGARSKWVVRIEFDKQILFDKNITMEDINYAIRNSSFREIVHCVYSDNNTKSNLVLRVRPDASLFKKRSSQPQSHPAPSSSASSAPPTASAFQFQDQIDDIAVLKKFQKALLEEIVLQGTFGLTNTSIRELKNLVKYNEGQYVRDNVWVIDTVGSNLLGVLGSCDDELAIDLERTYSNDIREVHDTLGIEAARDILMRELMEVMSEVYIDHHHLSLLCDRMTSNKDMVAIFRSGILNDNIGTIAKATFEVHTETFLNAGRHGLVDNMRGVSANIMCGQTGFYGTNAFQIVLDIDKVKTSTTSSPAATAAAIAAARTKRPVKPSSSSSSTAAAANAAALALAKNSSSSFEPRILRMDDHPRGASSSSSSSSKRDDAAVYGIEGRDCFSTALEDDADLDVGF